MHGWLSRPRSHGFTTAHPEAAMHARIANVIRICLLRANCMRPSSRPKHMFRQGFVCCLLSIASAACVGTGLGVPDLEGEAGEVPKSYADIQTLIFDPLCATCHRGGAAPKGLSLEADRAIDQLVRVPSAEAPSLMRVAPGQPDESYLVVKLTPSDARRVGARMPRTGPPYLSNPQVRAIRQWIRDGALENWVAPVVTATVGALEAFPAQEIDDAREAPGEHSAMDEEGR